MSESQENSEEVSQELIKILKDFIGDILTTFPEYKNSFTDNELEFIMDNPNQSKMYIQLLNILKQYILRDFLIFYMKIRKCF